MGVKVSHQVIANIASSAGNGDTVHGIAQSFMTAGTPFDCVSVEFNCARTGNPTDNWYAELWTAVGDTPGVKLATSNTVVGNSGIAGQDWRKFTFPTPVPLSQSTLYIATLRRSGPTDASNYWVSYGSNNSAYGSGRNYTISNTGVFALGNVVIDSAFRINDAGGWQIVGVGAVTEATGATLGLSEPAGCQQGDLLVACISARGYASGPNWATPLGAGWKLVTAVGSADTATNTSAKASGAMAFGIRGATNQGPYGFSLTGTASVVIGRIVAYRGGQESIGDALLPTADRRGLAASNTTWATARQNTIATSVPGAAVTVGVSTGFSCAQYFLTFDASGIPASVTSGTLALTFSSNLPPSANDLLEVRQVSSDANTIAGDSLAAAGTLLGVAAIPSNLITRMLIPLNLTNVPRTSGIILCVHSQKQRVNTAPATTEAPSINVLAGAALTQPRLEFFAGGSVAITPSATTAVSVPGLTTVEDDNLIVAMTAGGQEAAWSAFSNATTPLTASGAADTTTAPSTTAWIERADSLTSTGADTSLAIFDAVKATAGATGNLSATASLSAAHVVMSAAFKIAPPPIADAWNYQDKGINTTLSNGDKTVLGTGVLSGVRSSKANTFGKSYAEIVLLSGNPAIGLRIITGTPYSQGETAYIYPSTGNIYIAGGNQPMGIGALAANDVIGIAWDADADLIWFRKNGNPWNPNWGGNPAAGTGGISTVAAGKLARLWFSLNANGDSATIRTEVAEFTQAIPDGFRSWMGETPDAWNVNDINVPGISLSNNDKTVTVTNINRFARTTAHRSSGKYYAEFVKVAGTSAWVGIKNADAVLANSADSANISFIDGSRWTNGGNNGRGVNETTTAINDVMCVAVDFDVDKIWYRLNNGVWNTGSADPATNAGGYTISAVGGSSWALWFCSNQIADAVTVRTEKAEFTRTTPAGFLSWMGETLTIPDLGTLAGGAASMSGAGIVSSVGTAALAPAQATAQGFGVSLSSGTGVLTSVGYARTNYVKYSQDFEQPLWVQADVTITTNAALDPNWELTAERIGETGGAVPHYVYQSVSIPEGGVYTLSAYVKAESGQWFKLMGTSGAAASANFDVLNGQLGLALGCTSSITPAGAGWYRLSITALAGSPFLAGAITFYLFAMDADQSATTHPGAGRTYFIWGAQIDRGTVATPYIRTPANFAVSISETIIGHGDVSWVATGVLAPAERTNLFSRSEEFEPSWWLITGGTVTYNDIAAPNATMSADKFTDNATYEHHYVMQSVAFAGGASGKQFTFSMYAKAGTVSWLQFYAPDNWVNFNLSTGVIGQKSAGAAATITPVGNGWYRCTITYASGETSPSAYALLKDGDVAGVMSWLATGTGTMYFWGAQLELGDVATAYIPTFNNPVSVASGATLSAVGLVTSPPILGTGVLTSTAAAISSFGNVRSTGTGALLTSPIMRTNYAVWSEQIDRWTGGYVDVSSNAIAAPNGTLTADMVSTLAASGVHYVYQGGVGSPADTNFTFSVYLKRGTSTWVGLYDGNEYANFNLVTGAVGIKSAANVTPAIVSVGDGWWRCSITYPRTVGYSVAPQLTFLNANDLGNHAVGGLTTYVWGAQTEPGSQATGYIPTHTSSYESVFDVLTGRGVAQISVPPIALTGGVASVAGVGLSESKSTSAALNSQSNFLQLGAGQSSSTGTGTLTEPAHTVSAPGTAAWNASGVLTAVPNWRTNLICNSQSMEFQAPSTWFNSGVTVSGNIIAAPDSTMTAERLNDTAANLAHYIYQGSISVVSGQLYTVSCYAKAGTLNWFQIGVTATAQYYANFNLVTGQIGNKHASIVSASMEDAGNGWWRCSFTAASTGINTGQVLLATLLADTAVLLPSYVGGTGNLHLWGAQFEQGANATPYIPTLADPVSVAGYPLYGKGGVGWSGAGILPRTGTTFSTAIGVGAAAWTISGTMPSDIAHLAGVGVSGVAGTGTLTSGAADLDALGSAVTGVGGTGALTSFATMTGAGISRSYATVGAVLASQPATTVAPAISGSAGSGILPRVGIPLSALAGVAVSGSVGPAPLAAEGVIVEGAGLVRFVANGALATGVASLVSVGTASWRATGALASSAATAASVGTSRSFGTAPLLASLAYVSGFEGVTVISGTGTAQSQSSTMVASAVSRSTGAGDLPILTPAILTGVAVSQSRGTSVLTPSVAALVGTGVTFGAGTGSLTAQAAAVVSAGVIIAAPSGTGTPASQPATLAGTGIRSWAITGALAAQSATITAVAHQGWTATGVATAQAATVVGVGAARWSGTGTTPAQAATIVAAGVSRSVETVANLLSAKSWVTGEEGVTTVTGGGILPAQSRVMVGAGFSRSLGIGTMPVLDAADIAAVGISQSRGTSVLQDAASTLESEGTSRSIGSGLLPTGPVTLSGVGVSGYVGAAILPAAASSMSGTGIVETQGTGSLTQERPTVLAAGLSRSFGPAILISSPVVVEGEAEAKTGGVGNLAPAVSKIVGVAVGQSRGAGALDVLTEALLDGDAVSRSFGTGKLPVQRSRVAGFASITAFGSADLEPSPAVITGHNLIYGEGVLVAEYAAGDGMIGTGDIGEYTAPPPTGLPGSYPGTSTWYQTGYVPPPWWLGEAA